MTKINKIIVLGIIVAIALALVLIFAIDWNGLESREAEISKTELAENCARDIPREKIDDTSFDSENKVVQTYWWDNEIGDNVSIIFPYEPETDFAGCSESVKELLRHIQDIQEENIRSGKK
jgi:hypothetical protein